MAGRQKLPDHDRLRRTLPAVWARLNEIRGLLGAQFGDGQVVAPPAAVATNSRSARLSAAFSPSVTNMVVDAGARFRSASR